MNARDEIRIEGTDRVFDRRRILLVLIVPVFVSMLAVSAINVALPAIGNGMHATQADLQWLLAGYALAFGVSLIPAGRVGDVIGRGQVFLIGTAIFAIGSLLCGLAVNAVMLNAFRLLQGIGAGMFQPQTIGMIVQYYTGIGRAKAFAVFGMVVSASVAVGPLISGFIIDSLGDDWGWRASFLVNFPIGLAGVILAFMWLPFDTERRRRREKQHRLAGHPEAVPATKLDFDPLGAVLVSLGVVAVMWPFMGGKLASPWLWALLPAGLVLLAAFVAWERSYLARGREPMVDLRLFSFKSFSYQTAVTTFLFLGMTSTFAIIALVMQRGLGSSALAVGLVGLPNAIVSAWAAWWAGNHAIKHGHQLVVLGLAAAALGTTITAIILYLAVENGLNPMWMMFPLCLNGFGMGLIGSANQTLAMMDVPVHQSGTAGGVKSTFERTATAIGNAVLTGIFFGLLASGSDYGVSSVVALAVAIAIIHVAGAVAVMDWLRARKLRHII